MAGADFIDDGRFLAVFRLAVAEDPVPQVGILVIEQAGERRARGGRRHRMAFVQPPAKHLVEFARAAPTTPAQAREFGAHANQAIASRIHMAQRARLASR